MITRLDRAVGAVLGSAAGDALGAPYEFGPAGQLTARGQEMRGGGGWDPGEATDDTQMAVLVGESLLEHGGSNRKTSSAGSSDGRPGSPRTSTSRPRTS